LLKSLNSSLGHEPECRIDKPVSRFFYFLLSDKQSYANSNKLHRY
jgi:hypothetical protein